jgi:hypothetical protein
VHDFTRAIWILDMSASITNWTPVGGVFKHIEYKMEVNLDGAFWEVYRRYKSFEALDAAVRHVLGDSYISEHGFKPTLPGKDLPHYLNSSVVNKRMNALNEYLADIIAYNPPDQHKEAIRGNLREFLDTQNRGKSGVRVSIESSNDGRLVVREAFGLVARPSTFNMVYQGCFVALTSDKVLYVCSNVYDAADRAKHIISLNRGGYTVKGKDSIRFTLQGNDLNLDFKFTNENDAAHWMRAMGDATLMDTMARSTEASRRNDILRQQEEAEATARAQRDARDRAHAQNQADKYNTKDTLSSNFGI